MTGKRSTELRIGASVVLFAAVAVATALYMVYTTGDLRFERKQGTAVTVHFENASGLDEGDSVEVAGVEVGEVTEISLERGAAKIVAEIDGDVAVYRDAQASIETYGLLGDRYVNIHPGSAETGLVGTGAEIGQRISPESMDAILMRLGEVAEDVHNVAHTLSSVLGGEEGESSLRDIVENTRVASASLARTLARNEQAFARTMEQVQGLSADLAILVSENRDAIARTLERIPQIAWNIDAVTGDLAEVIGANREGLRTTMENLEEGSRSLADAMASIEEISRRINAGEGTVGRLLADDEMYIEARRVVRQMSEYVEDIKEQAPISAFLAVFGAAF